MTAVPDAVRRCRKLGALLTGLFLLAMVMGSGPGLRLVNPDPGDAAVVLGLSPFFPPLPGGDSLSNLLSDVKKMMDTGAWGLLANTATMALVSALGKDPTKATPLTPAG